MMIRDNIDIQQYSNFAKTLLLTSYQGLVLLFSIVLLTSLACTTASAQDWNKVSDGDFVVHTMSRADESHLSNIFGILRDAKSDLRRTWGLVIPEDIQIYIHPTIESYNEATELPWYVAAIANREEVRIDMQRVKVLLERQSLTKTLRHELFHLAQEEDLERWQAEGRAMIFSNEEPISDAFQDIDGEALNHMLEGFVDREELARANATAYLWAQRELASTNP